MGLRRRAASCPSMIVARDDRRTAATLATQFGIQMGVIGLSSPPHRQFDLPISATTSLILAKEGANLLLGQDQHILPRLTQARVAVLSRSWAISSPWGRTRQPPSSRSLASGVLAPSTPCQSLFLFLGEPLLSPSRLVAAQSPARSGSRVNLRGPRAAARRALGSAPPRPVSAEALHHGTDQLACHWDGVT